MASYASSSSSSTNPFSTVPGQLVNSGLSGLVDLGNKYKDNATIGGLVAGKIGDTFSTQANTGLALAYNDAFLGSLSSYQQALENTKKGNAMELMAAEGRIAKDMQGDQLATDRYKSDQELAAYQTKASADRYGYQVGAEANKYQADQSLRAAETSAGASKFGAQMGLLGTQEQAGAQRYSADKQALALMFGAQEQAGAQRFTASRQAEASMFGAREQAGAQRFTASRQAEASMFGAREQAGAQRFAAEREAQASMFGAEQQAGAQRYSAEQQAGAQRYGADRSLEASRYGADRQLDATRYTADSAERQIGLTGAEERKTLIEKTNQDLALRRDARGAIASAGRRFYG